MVKEFIYSMEIDTNLTQKELNEINDDLSEEVDKYANYNFRLGMFYGYIFGSIITFIFCILVFVVL